jgi:hypothetical protein
MHQPVTVRAVAMVALATWLSISSFRKSVLGSNNLRWYDRVIYFLGFLIMATLAVCGFLLLVGKIDLK